MKKIMVVDDESIFQYLAKTMLESAYDVVTVSSGEEALQCFEQEKPDLVLSDLMMPGMSGLELQDSLKQKYGGKTPVVFMTSDYRQETEVDGFRGGAMDFIHKPFQKEVLLRRIDIILSSISKMEDLQSEASTDLLTGLLNKVYAEKELTEICRNGQGTILLMDLDSFKLVNDCVGHDAGDKVLIKFSEVINSVVRNKDIAGRIGGDEFIIFCNNVINRNVVEAKARQIAGMFSTACEEILGQDSQIPIGVSIGAVYVPNEGTDFAELFKKADKALAGVKQNGKHGFAIYNDGSEKEAVPEGAGINISRAVLDERNEPAGAYEVGQEGFRDIYRFLKRSVKNYYNSVQYCVFTIGVDGDDNKLEEVMDNFGRTLLHSLRCSDVFTKNGKDQYWLLLLESNTHDAENVVINRILNNWKETHRIDDVEVIYEVEDI